ncbi:MFS transporter [Dyadobacter sp. MSC1_007]|jgi:MFS family permease|uniref:MFS transporter n=1 Tax=Dyadobacter sp. MSC1_007 TaxID=2909264 RepID=UPI00202EEA71|nr:MFS transporter [Dyadobacter sp. MSC1_007]
MILKPKERLTEQEVNTGLSLIIKEGLTTEAMTTLTGGTFLVAFALLLGANNFQIGLLASLPTFTNIFQLTSIWLIRKYNNRRAVAVICSVLARIPLLLIGILPFVFPDDAPINLLLFFLFFFYLFGSIAGPSWNAWMKDLVPGQMLGAYFSKRGRYSQILNVVLSVLLALAVDYIRRRYPDFELTTYAIMFLLAGLIGLGGAALLASVPEPLSYLDKENILKLFLRPLRDLNFRRLLVFNSAWLFAVNIATPFFTVFMLKTLGLTVAYVIPLTILSQLSSIMTIGYWGVFADRYSNKTIIAICAPLYLCCVIAWCFVGIYTNLVSNLALLALIHMGSGASNAGINLALTNIGLKLAPSKEAIVYLSVKNIITAVFSSLAPLIGGYLADYYTLRQLRVIAEWSGPSLQKTFRLLLLHEWNFLFLIGAVLTVVAIQLLPRVKEEGEVEKGIVKRIMRKSLRSNMRDYFVIDVIINWHSALTTMLRGKNMRGDRIQTPQNQ